MQTKDVFDCMNVALESAGEAAISSSDIENSYKLPLAQQIKYTEKFQSSRKPIVHVLWH